MKKLKYNEVEAIFSNKGCLLTSKEYINSKTKLDYICPNGHEHSITLNAFQNGTNCAICANKHVPTILEVQEAFEKKGYTLLSKSYVDNRTKLTYICDNGHTQSISWNKFQQNSGCPTCKGLDKPSISFVNNFFAERGYTMLATEYKNSKTYIPCICPNGHLCSIKWNDFQQGHGCAICATIARSSKNSTNWKGGVSKLNLPLYSTYASRLEKYNKICLVIQDDLELLGVECTYCKNIFVPSTKAIVHRLVAINSLYGDSNLYCSDECKSFCPTYRQHKYLKDDKINKNARHDQNVWAALVKELDNNICQICAASSKDMQAHHIIPVVVNGLLSLDLDNGITLCKNCHKTIHQLSWCTSSYLRNCK